MTHHLRFRGTQPGLASWRKPKLDRRGCAGQLPVAQTTQVLIPASLRRSASCPSADSRLVATVSQVLIPASCDSRLVATVTSIATVSLAPNIIMGIITVVVFFLAFVGAHTAVWRPMARLVRTMKRMADVTPTPTRPSYLAVKDWLLYELVPSLVNSSDPMIVKQFQTHFADVIAYRKKVPEMDENGNRRASDLGWMASFNPGQKRLATFVETILYKGGYDEMLRKTLQQKQGPTEV